ncbi:MAG: hypothetical protein J6M34_07630 [Clostridia bacterium]|nr:hypothetical protein [Clostridia bacterium]
MNERTVAKFNLYVSVILLALLLLFFVGATLAYFSDTKQATATLTAGNVRITLSESAVKEEGWNLVPDPESPRIFGGDGETVINDYGKIYPGQSIHKDPTVTNTGDSEEWIAAKVTLTDGAGDLTKIMGYEETEYVDIEVLLSGGLLDELVHVGDWNGIPDVCHNDRYAMIQIPNASEGTFEFIFLMLQPVQPGESVVLFDNITIPSEWDNAEMKQLVSLKINVQAYGVQITAMDSCLQAMTEAFPSHFNLS